MQFASVANYLRKLAVDEDADHWPDETLACILHETMVAISGLRPELFAEAVDLTPSADGSIELPAKYAQFLSVRGIKGADGRICTSLRMMSADEATKEDDCWRCADGSATAYVFDEADPFRLYANGAIPAGSTINVTASTCPDEIRVSGGVIEQNQALPRPCTLLPLVVDYALDRMYDRVDSAAGKQQMHFRRFREHNLLQIQVRMASLGGMS